MGRTYVVEETVGQYFTDVSLGGKAAVSGLLIGQARILFPVARPFNPFLCNLWGPTC